MPENKEWTCAFWLLLVCNIQIKDEIILKLLFQPVFHLTKQPPNVFFFLKIQKRTCAKPKAKFICIGICFKFLFFRITNETTGMLF